MSNEPCGLRLTENDIRMHLEILHIVDRELCEEIECLEEDQSNSNLNLKASVCRIAGVRRIIDAAKRDLQCTHDYLMDEMRKKGMTARFV